jgi:hypothetical protein
LKRIAVVSLALIVLLPVNSPSQSRKRTPTIRKSRTSISQRTSEEVRAGATRVADQIKVLTRFIYLLGGVAKGIEAVDEAVRRHEASPALLEQAQRNKATVKTSIQSVREGLDKLEIDFRTTPGLQRYYIKLAGVAAGAADAEQFAANNRLDEAGRSLLGVVNRLTDVLLEMLRQ